MKANFSGFGTYAVMHRLVSSTHQRGGLRVVACHVREMATAPCSFVLLKRRLYDPAWPGLPER